MKNSVLIKCLVILLMLTGLVGCGGHGGSSNNVGVTTGGGVGVSLTTPTGSTVIYEGTQIEIDATVLGDASNAGVTWSLVAGSVGTIASQTPTKLIYQAPASVVGAFSATVIATSITSPTEYSQASITVNGTPVILTPAIFPANEKVAYGTYLSVAGGTPPYVWSISAGTLPAGLSLSGSTSASTSIQGTPTAPGISTVTVLVTDYNGLTASQDVTLTVSPQTACLLAGQYAYLSMGLYQAYPAVRAGSFTVNATTGVVTGMFDAKNSGGASSGAALTDGLCATRAQNYGEMTMVSASRNEKFNYVTASSLNLGHLQQNDSTGDLAAGQFTRQDSAAFNFNQLQGAWVFGVVGDDGQKNRLVEIGQLSLDASGAAIGVADNNAVSNAAVNGTLSALFTVPDANGRGTVTWQVNGQSLPMAYYVVDANSIYLVSNDTSLTTPRVAGRMTRQSGLNFDSTSLTGPGITSSVLSLWGSTSGQSQPNATVALARLSGSTAQTGNASAAVDVALDTVASGAVDVYATYAAQSYSVAAINGRGSLTLSASGAATRTLVFYTDGAGGGYFLEPSSAAGNFGILQPQIGVPFTSFAATYFQGGTMFAVATAPISTLAQLLLQNGSLSGAVSGSYALYADTGRVVASVSRTLLGGSDLVIYLLSANALVAMGDGLNSQNSQIAWFEAF